MSGADTGIFLGETNSQDRYSYFERETTFFMISNELL